jgi:hypothetical protein
MLRVFAVLASFAFTSALFAAGSVDFSVSSGETIQIELWGTSDSNVQLIDTDTGQVVASGGMMTYSGGNYTNQYWGYGEAYLPGVSFTIGTYSYITGLPTGNYRLSVSTPGCTGWGSGSGMYYYISDWSSWDVMDYTIYIY